MVQVIFGVSSEWNSTQPYSHELTHRHFHVTTALARAVLGPGVAPFVLDERVEDQQQDGDSSDDSTTAGNGDGEDVMWMTGET
ncbi:unnamed protein product [Vitrella brassicaformis CCMP3155]|uniref:Uncharacterized protein n=1 Tax=Vitrella brassicaformis (strain CCMP3155) TaxID=1169540 RepID=A0A0G4GH74_VITBC|nr:unnamed protein product [Vitrella brassicaformis CCMP3155]|eukprot:CEM29112.1 unnamed protein product [Vitrella brassicaformis CCMP3155]